MYCFHKIWIGEFLKNGFTIIYFYLVGIYERQKILYSYLVDIYESEGITDLVLVDIYESQCIT